MSKIPRPFAKAQKTYPGNKGCCPLCGEPLKSSKDAICERCRKLGKTLEDVFAQRVEVPDAEASS